MTAPDQPSYRNALNDFMRARRRAAFEALFSMLTGRQHDLLSYDDVRRKLHGTQGSRRELREIPLDAIVGSVERHTDFTRSFLPRLDSDRARWAGVGAAVSDIGLPPIEVFQIGDAYFVHDGNHRVSVARNNEAPTIQAWVTPVHTRVPLSRDDDPHQILLKAKYAEFLELVPLDKLCPELNFMLSNPDDYRVLYADIQGYHFVLEHQCNCELTPEEGMRGWLNDIYLPTIEVVRRFGLLDDFPNHTEADLYVWLVNHRAFLAEILGWDVSPERAAEDLLAFNSPRQRLTRLSERLIDVILPDALETGPPVGEWRRTVAEVAQRRERFLLSLLVPVSGSEASWSALDQALMITGHTNAHLKGLHVVADVANRESDAAQAVRRAFEQRCVAAGATGRLIIEAGPIARTIVDRARFTDAIVLHLAHPPEDSTVGRLNANIRTILRRSPRPVFLVPQAAQPLRRILLAYNNSPKSREALFIATYLAGAWDIPLFVLSIDDPTNENLAEQELASAEAYITEHGVQATYISETGPVAETILATAAQFDCSLLLIGGYKANPVIELMRGSVVDQLLRESTIPVLVAR